MANTGNDDKLENDLNGVLITPDASSDEERMKHYNYIGDEWKESMILDTPPIRGVKKLKKAFARKKIT